LQDWMDFIMLLSGSIICMSENSFPSITLLNLGKNSYLLTMAYNSVYQRNMYSNHKKKSNNYHCASQCCPTMFPTGNWVCMSHYYCPIMMDFNKENIHIAHKGP
jgi:hypothetical protein